MKYGETLNPNGTDIRVSVRLSAGLKQKFLEYCERHKLSGSKALRHILERELEADERRMKYGGTVTKAIDGVVYVDKKMEMEYKDAVLNLVKNKVEHEKKKKEIEQVEQELERLQKYMRQWQKFMKNKTKG